MSIDNANEIFEAQELVIYAKALMRNHQFLRLLDQSFTGYPPKFKHSNATMIRELSEAFHRGCFLEMRRLSPNVTDEAIENRIIRLSRIFGNTSIVDPSDHRTLNDFVYLLPKLLHILAETFLCEGNDGSIRVRTRLLDIWQDLLLVVPPLLISGAWISSRLLADGDIKPSPDRQLHVAHRLSRWLCDSTLPVDDSPFLDYICRTHGLDEVHMHLNGTTEAEKVWCDVLRRPDKVVGQLLNAKLRDSGLRVPIGNGVVRLLYQEDSQLTPRLLRIRADIAITLKAALLRVSLGENNIWMKKDSKDDYFHASYEYRKASIAVLAHVGRHSPSCVVQEAWQLCKIFSVFSQGQASVEDGLFLWHYSLLRAQFCRLLVQQKNQSGFDQFQYITQNELREESEKNYAERFRQVERGHQRGVDHLEGRFAPKSTPAKTAVLLKRILRGYIDFLSESEQGHIFINAPKISESSLSELVSRAMALETGSQFGRPGDSDTTFSQRSLRRLRFGLIAHFIKKQSSRERCQFFSEDIRPLCRDISVRREIDQAARALTKVLRDVPSLSHFVRGIDAASNERHAAPEVFAPAFRRMRAAGIKRITFHAGEDFIHIASGLRAMFEAVYFLELDAGCRLGHGTASGLNVKSWWESVGPFIVMSLEDRLDDLLFTRYIIFRSRKSLTKLPLVELEIQRLAQYIWQDPTVTPDALTRAWLLRELDPLVMEISINDVEPRRKFEAYRFEEAKRIDPVAHGLYLRRHGVGAQSAQLRRCREDIVIDRSNDILDEELLRTLQDCVISELRQRQIAIETLPSSNVRISIHETYDSHHAQNWLLPQDTVPAPPVCFTIGSDDPGIFATSLRMEYAHLLRPLQVLASRMNTIERADLILEKVCLDAKKFRF